MESYGTASPLPEKQNWGHLFGMSLNLFSEGKGTPSACMGPCSTII